MPLNIPDLLQKIRTPPRAGASFVGVDIGSSSTKIVQLSVKDNVATLETYGEISNAPYADSEPGKAAHGSASKHSAELSDILHEVNAQSRTCAVAVPLSETLINIVDLPKRDPEQMRRIVRVEAQQYIPVSVDTVMLDWYALPEEAGSAFDTLKPKTQTVAQFQKVMIVAVTNEAAHKLGDIVHESGLTSKFYEIEMFSTARACAHATLGPALIIDFGASATKAYIVNEHWLILAARLIPIGGQAMSEEVMKSLSCDFPAAERAKCEQGLSGESKISSALSAALTPVITYLQQMIEEHHQHAGKPLQHILLSGGGSYMPGIMELLSNKLSLPTETIRAFDHINGPMILEHMLREDGPRFAVATGLALRGIGR